MHGASDVQRQGVEAGLYAVAGPGATLAPSPPAALALALLGLVNMPRATPRSSSCKAKRQR